MDEGEFTSGCATVFLSIKGSNSIVFQLFCSVAHRRNYFNDNIGDESQDEFPLIDVRSDSCIGQAKEQGQCYLNHN